MANLTLERIPASIPIGKARSSAAVVVDVDEPHGQLEIAKGGITWTPKAANGAKQNASAITKTWRGFVDLLGR